MKIAKYSVSKKQQIKVWEKDKRQYFFLSFLVWSLFSNFRLFFPIIILLDCMHSEDASCFRHA